MVVGTDAIHIGPLSAAPDVPCADHDRDLHARIDTASDLFCNPIGKFEIQNSVRAGGKCLARQLQQYPAVFRLCFHM